MHLCYNEYLLSLPAPVHVLSLLPFFIRIYISICIFIDDIYNANIYYIHSPLYFYYCFNPVSDYFHPPYITTSTIPVYIYILHPPHLLLPQSPPSLYLLLLPTLLLYIYCYFAPFYCVFNATSPPSVYLLLLRTLLLCI